MMQRAIIRQPRYSHDPNDGMYGALSLIAPWLIVYLIFGLFGIDVMMLSSCAALLIMVAALRGSKPS